MQQRVVQTEDNEQWSAIQAVIDQHRTDVDEMRADIAAQQKPMGRLERVRWMIANGFYKIGDWIVG